MCRRQAKGQYVAFLDADDVWMPDKLEKEVPLLERNETVGMVCSDVSFFDESGDRPGTVFETYPPQSGMVYSVIFTRSFITLPTVRRSCFDDVGYFDETLTSCEDHDMWLRISKKWAVDFINEPLYKYGITANQMSGNRERMLYNLTRVQERAFADSPELHELDLDTLDRCFYDLYLQLASVHIRNGRRSEARSVLRRYVQARGCTFRYYRMWLVSWTPAWLLNLVFAMRRHIQSLWHPAAL